MESISDLLGRRQPPQEPDEVGALKRYIAEQFDAPSSIAVQPKAIIVTVASASLANTLRLRTTDLQKIVGTTKRLVFRIG